MKGDIGGEDDGVVDVVRDALEAFDGLVHDLDEPPWSSAASLWYNHPLEEARSGVESSERHRVVVRYLMRRRYKVDE